MPEKQFPFGHAGLVVLALPILWLILVPPMRVGAAADRRSTDRVLVGVNYFAGWWQPLPNKWNYSSATGDWRTNFPGRVSWLGEYNTQDTMDREIVVAAKHGIQIKS